MAFVHHPLTGEQGKRQHWCYEVKFGGGEVKNFTLSCPAIPIVLHQVDLLASLNKIQRQEFTEAGINQLKSGQEQVERLLTMKGYWGTYGDKWTEFFSSMPQSDNDPRFPKLAQKSFLKELALQFKTDIKVSMLIIILSYIILN